MLQRIRKILDRRIGIAVLYALADAMPKVTFQYHEANLVESSICGTDLGEDVLARNVLTEHLLYAIQLPNDPVDPNLERVGISHAVSHFLISLKFAAYYTPWGMQSQHPKIPGTKAFT